MPRSPAIDKNKLLEYLEIVKLKGISDKHFYEVNRYLGRYLKYIGSRIDKSKSIVYFNKLKDKYSISSYRKETYQILKFLKFLRN